MNKRETGSTYESVAARYLEEQGYMILERNFRCRNGEIDIIAKDGQCLCFTEVKYRRTTRYGYPADAVSPYKQHIIQKAAAYYLYRNHYDTDTMARFDAILINNQEIIHIKNAFGGF